MADNFDFTPGTGGTGAADDIGGILYPRVKLIYGADGASSGDVSATNPLPVVVSSGTTSISGTVTITGSTAIVGTVTTTGNTTVTNTVNITGSTAIVGAVTVTGMTACNTGAVVVSGGTIDTITNAVTITGSTTILGTVTVTGSTAIVGTVTITGSTAIVGSVTVTGSTAIVGAVTLAQKAGKFNGSVTTTNCTTAVQVIAAVSATTTYITAYMISAIAAGSYWLEDGAGTALTPYHFFAANGGVSFSCDPSTPISTAITNTTIKIKSTVAGSTGCLVIGYQA